MQVIHDVNCLISEVRGDYVGHISHYLSSCSSEVLDVVRKSMLQGVESLQNVLPLLKKTIIEVIVDQSVEVKTWRNIILIVEFMHFKICLTALVSTCSVEYNLLYSLTVYSYYHLKYHTYSSLEW